MSAIGSSLSSNYLQLISNTLQSAGVANGAVSPAGQQNDNSRLSPLAQLLDTLQRLELSNPTKYKQVTEQISTNLQAAAQSAQSAGNTTAADQLNQLATDFSNASKSGQLPNIQDLAQAAGGHHHHHHHAASSSSDSDTGSTTQSAAPNPLTIILNTLANAGISTATS